MITNCVFSDEFQTEFMVDMSCEGCVKSVRTKLEPLEGKKFCLCSSLLLDSLDGVHFLDYFWLLCSSVV